MDPQKGMYAHAQNGLDIVFKEKCGILLVPEVNNSAPQFRYPEDKPLSLRTILCN